MLIARWSASLTAVLAFFLVPTTAAAETRTVFVTSTFGSADLSTWAETDLDGLAGADQICAARASAEALTGTFRAWLSTSTTDAYCHLFNLTGTKANACNAFAPVASSMGPWVRMDGTPFAGNLAQMTGPAHAVFQPVLFDETGTPVEDVEFWAWTGTDEDGEEFGGTCGDWSSTSGTGGSGIAWYVGAPWTYDVSSDCDGAGVPIRLYCFEVGAGDPLDLPREPGALVFVTSVSGSGKLSSWPDAGGESGMAAGDAICQARARAGFLPNPDSFFAYLSDSTTWAIDRITTGGPFVRVDGFLFAPSKAALFGTTPDLRTGLNVTELETYYVGPQFDPYVWTGTSYTGEALDHCVDWDSDLQADGGNAGNSAATRFTWTTNGVPSCDQSQPIYCFSNVELLFWDNFERGNLSRWAATTGAP